MGSRFFYRLPLLLLVAGALFLALNSPLIRTFFTAFTTTIQGTYLHLREDLHEGIERHLHQARKIAELERRNRDLEARLIRYRARANAYVAMREALGVKPDCNLTVVPVQAQGYARLGNFQQVWLASFPTYDPLRNYGVIRNGRAVGIVVEKHRRPLMILAGDRECNFAVYIGKNRAPGIAKGLDARHMVVRYIPEWMRIEPGAVVVTSGLDNLFPLGVPVGRVLSIRKMQGFKNATIELFGDTLHPDFVWVVGR